MNGEKRTEEECAFLPGTIQSDKHSRSGQCRDQGPDDGQHTFTLQTSPDQYDRIMRRIKAYRSVRVPSTKDCAQYTNRSSGSREDQGLLRTAGRKSVVLM